MTRHGPHPRRTPARAGPADPDADPTPTDDGWRMTGPGRPSADRRTQAPYGSRRTVPSPDLSPLTSS
ncbi:hypothetical protein SBD_3619 [Streptomyces bottropensis ATCC 25435]|uniref:Uncharacterized protein n=1 Tax=Streptomyces bottropensis ATCC 25435 TaxID=1054862 RepID=M3DC62_9ACTN|nr:hypothetical protein SBD_3619 [Streptomyces bottropensis ATCC 25435]